MKHVCKLCNKSYPCGRSLGGHMRSHMIASSSEAGEKAKSRIKILVSSYKGGTNGERDSEFEVGEHSGYGLRENPKKTWRVGDSSLSLQQGNACKECGKVFKSLKALFGHMSSHSGKKRISNNFKDQSDTETDASMQQKKIRSGKYHTGAVSSASFCLDNGSSTAFGIEQEQVEVALCLLMLSRDSGHWGGFDSVVQSSDNNSVVLEAKSSPSDVSITQKELTDWVSVGEMKDAEDFQYENSDSGYFWDGEKKVESEVSDDEDFSINEIKCPELVYGANLGHDLKRFQSETKLKKDFINEKASGHANRASMKYNSRKKANGYGPKKITHDSSEVEACKNAQKKSTYARLTCNKTFSSHQSLWGHQTSHKRISGGFTSGHGGSYSIEPKNLPDPMLDSKLIDLDWPSNAEKKLRSKIKKRHKCPICLKVFTSGQALGGHKRSHLIGIVKEKNTRTINQHEVPEISELIDLNLTPTGEDSSN